MCPSALIPLMHTTLGHVKDDLDWTLMPRSSLMTERRLIHLITSL